MLFTTLIACSLISLNDQAINDCCVNSRSYLTDIGFNSVETLNDSEVKIDHLTIHMVLNALQAADLTKNIIDSFIRKQIENGNVDKNELEEFISEVDLDLGAVFREVLYAVRPTVADMMKKHLTVDEINLLYAITFDDKCQSLNKKINKGVEILANSLMIQFMPLIDEVLDRLNFEEE